MHRRIGRLSFILVLTPFVFGGCGPSPESRYESGYSDGYAAGYNTTCQVRRTLIEGAWDDQNYSNGYREGYAAGALDCTKRDR
jgi:hypothetical protein